MKFRLEWIASYLDGPLPEAGELRRRLTDVGFIVEGVEGEGAGAVLEVELTANRPDAMNHRGLGREAAAALGRAFVDAPAQGSPLPEGARAAAELASVTIEAPDLCTRYSARVLEGIRVGEASAAVRGRLEAIGSNPISGPVDATNHVLWDVGQPLHAFDLDLLAKGADGRPALVVRRARAGETLVTLDGVERTLDPSHLVIADAERPVALAGVMGGMHSAISERTTRILLESAHFSPSAVRRTARALGMHTDASHRFERGTDPSETVDALDRAARLILADSGGVLARGVIDVVARPAVPVEIGMSLARMEAFLGMAVPAERVLAIFSSLGFGVVREGDAKGEGPADRLKVTVPTARVDLAIEEDLFEEVIRHVGYASLPETLPPSIVPGASAPAGEREDRGRDLLCGMGFVECQTYSFVSADEFLPFALAAPGPAPVVLENPLGEPFSTMRPTPVVGLLRSASHNVRRGQLSLALFEVGRSYGREGKRPVAVESRRAAFLLHGAGASGPHFTSPGGRPVDFFDGSGVVSALFRGFGAASPRFVPTDLPFLAPGRGARIVAPDGRDAGWVGVLAAGVASAWDLVEPVAGDVDLSAVPVPEGLATVGFPPRFPGSEVDLTVSHRLSVPWAVLEAAARDGAPPELASVEARDRYTGPGVPAGFVKTTATLRFGSPERSLSREEVNAWRDACARRFLALPETRVDGIS